MDRATVVKTLTYRDAIKILGTGDNALVTSLDKVLGGVLLAATPGLPDVLSLFDAKSEFTRLCHRLAHRATDSQNRLGQFDRIERLHAARSVLVVVSFFDAAEDLNVPLQIKELKITAMEKLKLARGQGSGITKASRLGEVASFLLESDIPLPDVHSPQSAAREAFGSYYSELSARFRNFISGLEIADRRPDALQQLIGTLSTLPRLATRKFESNMRSMAADSPEVAIWLQMAQHEASQTELSQLRVSINDVNAILTRSLPIDSIEPALEGLVRYNRSRLDRKIIEPTDLPAGLDAPRLNDAYIEPNFRMVQATPRSPVSDEDWWDQEHQRSGLFAFLLGHLATQEALTSPVLLLGHPGAGKSLFTEVLAARLPSPDFVTVRVPLRDVPADAEIPEQVESAIHMSTHETISWPEFARSAQDSVIVLLLDGFDELLQATGASMSDYLSRAKRFQDVEATQNRHVVILVTSRVTVADRMRIPGTLLALRLEDFDLFQVVEWVETWNETNEEFLNQNGRSLLDVDVLTRYMELSAQPLLLLMLALYDSEANALRKASDELGHADLYERLLTQFAEREVAKRSDYEDDIDLAGYVESELTLLSIVALGMFNRGTHWITEADLSEDLAALGATAADARFTSTGRHESVSSARSVLGKFFFIHRARATYGEKVVSTYEFLHATFWEYLVARLTTNALTHLVDRASRDRSNFFGHDNRVSDAQLRAFLSFSMLSEREPIISFLSELISQNTLRESRKVEGVLTEVFREALLPQTDLAYDKYRPVSLAPTARHAVYSANIVLLLLITGGSVRGRDLFGVSETAVADWRSMARLWQSQVRAEAWSGLIRYCRISRIQTPEGRDIVIERAQSRASSDNRLDVPWSRNYPDAADSGRKALLGFSTELKATSDFICDPELDMVTDAIGGPENLLGLLMPYYLASSPQDIAPVLRDLLNCVVFEVDAISAEDRLPVYERLISAAATGGPFNVTDTSRWQALVLDFMSRDDTVQVETVIDAYHRLPDCERHPATLKSALLLLHRCDNPQHVFQSIIFERLDSISLDIEAVAEIWCRIAECGVSPSEFPMDFQDRGRSLQWPGRDSLLSHRPDLLRRLSRLEDEQLL